MAPIELLWAEKIIKYSNRIIAAIAIKKRTRKIYNYKGVYIYIQEEFIDYTL